MLRSPHGLHRPLSLLVLAAVVAVAALASAGEFEREFTLEGERLELWDLIGAVELEPGRGDDFQVLVRVRGEDADEDLIGFEVDEGRTARLVIAFPLDEHRRYVYPEMGRGSSTTMSLGDWGRDRDSGWLSGIFGKKIRISGRGSGLELWCDVTIRVPGGKAAAVRIGAGRIDASGVRGDLDLDTASGVVTARDQEGDLLIDTGSGSVEVLGAEGDLDVDTGSGHVTVERHAGGDLRVDTGSGGVDIDGADCGSLEVDTGSGGVEARGVRADDAEIDTGSGGVTLVLDRMGDGRFVIDTGSGGIRLELPEDASARISAGTGSGSVRVDVPGVELSRRDRDHAEFEVGDGAARVTLDAGSGSIRIVQ